MSERVNVCVCIKELIEAHKFRINTIKMKTLIFDLDNLQRLSFSIAYVLLMRCDAMEYMKLNDVVKAYTVLLYTFNMCVHLDNFFAMKWCARMWECVKYEK